MSLLTKLRKSRGGVLNTSLIIGFIISTTPIFDGCSRSPEAPSAPSEQPSVAAPAGAPQESSPAAAQSPPAAPSANPAGEAAPPPGAGTAPSGGTPPPAGEAAAPAPALATPEQLQRLVSPIALYPDMLVAQILAASTYPTEVLEAARFIRQNPNLTGDALAAQVNAQPWDPSVRSLCQFPSVLAMMSRNVSWTTQLGGAYYSQPRDVLAAIQMMRRRAMRARTLRSTSQQRVEVEAQSGGEGQVIVIQPVQPNMVYVPTYNPTLVYGAPMPPPPGYSFPKMMVAGVVGFGAGMLVSSLINNGNNNWGTNWYGGNVVYNRNVFVSNSNYFVGPGYRPGYPGNRPGYPPGGNLPGTNLGTNKPGRPVKPGGTNLAATKPSKPMAKNLLRGNTGKGGNRRGPNGSVGGAKPHGSGQASAKHLPGSHAGTGGKAQRSHR